VGEPAEVKVREAEFIVAPLGMAKLVNRKEKRVGLFMFVPNLLLVSDELKVLDTSRVSFEPGEMELVIVVAAKILCELINIRHTKTSDLNHIL